MLCVSDVIAWTGLRLPIRALSDLAHAHGLLMVVDGAQAVGQVPVDVAALGCDAYAASGHKMSRCAIASTNPCAHYYCAHGVDAGRMDLHQYVGFPRLRIGHLSQPYAVAAISIDNECFHVSGLRGGQSPSPDSPPKPGRV